MNRPRALLTVVVATSVALSFALGCGSTTDSSGSSGDDSGTRDDATSGTHDGAPRSDAGRDAPGFGSEAAAENDTSTGTDSTMPVDAGADTNTDDSAADAGVDANVNVDAGVDTGAPDCGATPTLHAEPPGSIYCGFVDGGALTCTTGQQCCLGGALGGGAFGPELCQATGTACNNGGSVDAGGSPAIPIACMQLSDCTANGIATAKACCLQGAIAPAPLPGCTYPKASRGTAIVCETAAGSSPVPCAAGEVQMCISQADCPTGTTCTAGRWKVYQVGFCL